MNGSSIETQNGCPGKGKNYGRVSSDDELRILLYHLLQCSDKTQLTRGRKSGFGFVEQIKAAGHEAGLKQGHKTFTMGTGIEAISITFLDCGELTSVCHARL